MISAVLCDEVMKIKMLMKKDSMEYKKIIGRLEILCGKI